MPFELPEILHDGNQLIRGDILAIDDLPEIGSQFDKVIDCFAGALAVRGILELVGELV